MTAKTITIDTMDVFGGEHGVAWLVHWQGQSFIFTNPGTLQRWLCTCLDLPLPVTDHHLTLVKGSPDASP